jgi:Zn-finger nucleic acid-binding protein
MKCPKCKVVEMVPATYEGVEIDRCPRCEGMYFDKGELEHMLESGYAEGVDSSEFTVLSDKHDMMVGRCQRCDVEMRPMVGQAKLRIDRCPNCGGIYLDQGELATMRNA